MKIAPRITPALPSATPASTPEAPATEARRNAKMADPGAALKSDLAISAALGVSPSTARSNAAHALSFTATVQTTASIEAQADAIAASRSSPDLHASLARFFAAAHAERGSDGIEAGFEAMCAALPEPRDATAKTAIEGARARGIEALLAVAPRSPAEILSRARSLERLASSSLKTGNAYSDRFLFSNENGLGDVARTLQSRGGIAAGVSGGVLDLACATKADAVLSVDVDPSLPLFMRALTGLLLGLDVKAQREQLTETQRADVLQAALKNGETSLLDELALDPEERAPLRELIAATRPTPQFPNNWLLNPDRGANVMHLTALAKAGRLLGLESDLADPTLAPRLKAVQRGLQSEVRVFNLSNAIDYIKDLEGVAQTLAETATDAEIVANTYYDHMNKVPEIGSFKKPHVSSAGAWAGDHGIAARFLEQGRRRSSVPDDDALAKERARVQAMLDGFDPAGALAERLRSSFDMEAVRTMGEQPPEPAPHERPRSRELVAKAAARVWARFWTAERLHRYAQTVNGWALRHDPDYSARFFEQAKLARTPQEIHALAQKLTAQRQEAEWKANAPNHLREQIARLPGGEAALATDGATERLAAFTPTSWSDVWPQAHAFLAAARTSQVS